MRNQRTAVKIGIGIVVLLLLFSTFNPALFSQTKNVGIGTENPNSSALLDLDVSNNTEFPTKKGLLIPRVALTGTNDNTTITSPEASLLIYNTATASDVTPGFYYWSGTAWVKLKTSADAYPYLPLAGGSMTGAINMQNNLIENIGNTGTDFTASGGLNLADAVSATRFTSTVATGTSPFTIASNTLVANLNADLLDGKNPTDSAWNANKLKNINISSQPPTASQLLQFNGTEWAPATLASSGTVTSVALEIPTNEFNITGSPITDDDTISITWKSQTANSFLAAPWNTSGTPQFRTLTAEFIPNLPATKITEGTLPVARGGTGGSSFNGILKGNLSAPMTTLTATQRQVTFWSSNNEISGTDSLKWAAGTFSITGDLQVTGEIDPISLTLIPQEDEPTAAEGKIYYDNVAKGLKVYNGTEWVALGSGGTGLPAGTEENQTLRYNGTDWVASSVLKNTGSKIGIGTASPDSTLHIVGTAYFTSNTRIGENLLVDGSISYTPTTVVEGTENINPAGKTYIKVNLTGTFTLSDGTSVGQIIILQKISSGTALLVHYTESNPTNCILTGDWSGDIFDTIQLIWDGSYWVEVSRSNNIIVD